MEGGHETQEGNHVEEGSGVVELDWRPMTDAEVAAAQAATPDLPVSSPAKIGPALEAAIRHASAEGGAAPALPVLIVAARPNHANVALRMKRAVAEGLIPTKADYEIVRTQIMQDVASETAANLAPVLDALAERGVMPDFVGTHSTIVQASLNANVILDLEGLDDVVRIDLNDAEAGGPMGADGQEEAEAMQFRLFWDLTYTCFIYGTCRYDGENGENADLVAATVDTLAPRSGHVAFKDGSGTTTRFAGMWDCTTLPCQQKSPGDWANPADGHGTAVLGALLGDYNDGQQSGLTVDQQEQRSAAAGESYAHAYKTSLSHMSGVMDHVASSTNARMLVSSIGFHGPPQDFSDCNGDQAIDQAVNQLFENGVAYFQAVGDDFASQYDPVPPWDTDEISGSSTNCTAWDPASAIGAFTVSGYDQQNGSPLSMRNAVIHPESSWGGAPSNFDEGRYHTVVDLAAPWIGDNTPTYISNTSLGSFKGASNSNPTAASAALAFTDMMKQLHGNFIDDPGVLYAWLLNMGDRYSASSGYLNVGYDNRFGAGRMMLRFISTEGMDYPYWWYHYELCVGSQQVITLAINNGNTLSSDADSLRATAWWYDRRFGNQVTIADNIDLLLKKTDGTGLRYSQSLFDNKERIYYHGIGGKAVKLEVHGTAVGSDDEGCGTNKMRVWVTILIEDDDRDDANGPSWDDVAEVGVQPL